MVAPTCSAPSPTHPDEHRIRGLPATPASTSRTARLAYTDKLATGIRPVGTGSGGFGGGALRGNHLPKSFSCSIRKRVPVSMSKRPRTLKVGLVGSDHSPRAEQQLAKLFALHERVFSTSRNPHVDVHQSSQ